MTTTITPKTTMIDKAKNKFITEPSERFTSLKSWYTNDPAIAVLRYSGMYLFGVLLLVIVPCAVLGIMTNNLFATRPTVIVLIAFIIAAQSAFTIIYLIARSISYNSKRERFTERLNESAGAMFGQSIPVTLKGVDRGLMVATLTVPSLLSVADTRSLMQEVGMSKTLIASSLREIDRTGALTKVHYNVAIH